MKRKTTYLGWAIALVAALAAPASAAPPQLESPALGAAPVGSFGVGDPTGGSVPPGRYSGVVGIAMR